jgi:hypothetical protein
MVTRMSAERRRRTGENILSDLEALAEGRGMARDRLLWTIKEPAEAQARGWDNFPAPLRLLTDSGATDKLSGGVMRSWGINGEWAWTVVTTRPPPTGRHKPGQEGRCSVEGERLRAQA